MSQTLTSRDHSRVFAWSVWLYRRLLLVYPAPFRTAYGPQMTQVFRDCCRQAQRERGLPGVGRLWLRTLADLAVSALAEHCKGAIAMSRWTPTRYCGLAAILGGAIWIAYALYMVVMIAFTVLSGNSTFTGPTSAVAYIFDASWILFPLALVGLLALAAGRVGVVAWLGFTVAFFGGLMLLVGTVGMTYVQSLLVQSITIQQNGVQVVHITGYDPVGSSLESALYAISFLGYPVLGIGVALAGLSLWRAHALPLRRWQFLLFGLGVFAAIQYFFSAMGAPPLLQDTGTPGLLVMVIEWALFTLAWAVGWILLGRRLWVATETPAAQGQPASTAAPQTQAAAG